MGMFDSIWIDDKVIEVLNIKCPACKILLKGMEWQTKSFDSLMESYHLRGVDKCFRLYKLNDPHDKKFWHQYTQEEIDEMKAKEKGHNHQFIKSLNEIWIAQGGYWKEEAYYPENRIRKSMGDLPHQWVRICTICKCDRFVDFNFKFTDGVLVDVVAIKEKEE